MSNPEFRVRPVIRHVVTRFSEDRTSALDEPPAYTRKLETLGEFDSEGYAEIVAEALAEKAAPREYVIVQETLGKVMAKVYYAYSEDEVNMRLMEPELQGSSYRVYSRIKQSL
jgi:hypothetical protein